MSNNATIIEMIAINLFSPFEIVFSFLFERKDLRWICRRVVAHKTMLYEMLIFSRNLEGETSHFRGLKYSPCGLLCYFTAMSQGRFSCPEEMTSQENKKN